MKNHPLLFSLSLAAATFALGTIVSTVTAADEKPAKTVVRIELPAETAAYRPGPGVQQAQASCMICHSADYVAMQPPMPRKFWEATIKKMKDKYGAPMPEDITPLVDYFTTSYGTK